MEDQFSNRILALAAVCQAAALVQMAARKGQVTEKQFKASINSIVVTQPGNTAEVFSGVENVSFGLQTLIAQLGNKPVEKDAEVTRYIASLLGLERKLSRHPKRLQELGERIEQIQRQQLHMDLFEEPMIRNLASIYSDVISPMGAKIQVAGTPALLQQQSTQNKVRATLLAGVRAAVLWRQLGGKRRQILFNRSKIVTCARNLLQRSQQL